MKFFAFTTGATTLFSSRGKILSLALMARPRDAATKLTSHGIDIGRRPAFGRAETRVYAPPPQALTPAFAFIRRQARHFDGKCHHDDLYYFRPLP